MALTALYLAIAVLLAPAIFAVAEWRGEHHLRHRWFYSLVAGLLWPVIALGLLQYAALAGVRRVMKEAPAFDFSGMETDADGSQLPSLSVPYVPMGRPAV